MSARDPIDASAVRNLDEIQEDDPSAQPSRAGALVLASLGGACIVFSAVLLLRSPPKAKVQSADPLGDLVAQTKPAAMGEPSDGVGQDVTFPALLSDAKRPTTALEAAREGKAASTALPFELPPGAPTAPPPATDRLPVVPLPAQNVLEESSADPPSTDTLATMARQASREPTSGEMAPAGTAGGYQLQVSSFKTQNEADGFATALRRRGHKAYVEPAQVKGRGLWYRVRIGPFKYRHSAVIYRQDFEAKERMVTFIVDPPKGEPGGGGGSAKVRLADDE